MSIVVPCEKNGTSNGTPNGTSSNGSTVASLDTHSLSGPTAGSNGLQGTYAQSHVHTQDTSVVSLQNAKRSWIVGKLPPRLTRLHSGIRIETGNAAPRVGDCIVGRIAKVGSHTRLFTDENQYSRIYKDDLVIGALGTRYATDAYHANEIDPANLHMLTNGGLIGSVLAQHSSMKKPTQIELAGYWVDAAGKRINLKDELFRPATHFPTGMFPVFTVGTGMNSGKTTSTARLGQALVRAGHRVAVLKLTGSASHRDVHEFNATGALFTADFTDYGFPSTYKAPLKEIEGLYSQMVSDAASVSPDVVLIEIADGVFQRETEGLLKSPLVRSTASGVVLTAACAASALAIDQSVRNMDWNPIAITGLLTNSPLFVQEFSQRSQTPVVNTGEGVQEACRLIMSHVDTRKSATTTRMS